MMSGTHGGLLSSRLAELTLRKVYRHCQANVIRFHAIIPVFNTTKDGEMNPELTGSWDVHVTTLFSLFSGHHRFGVRTRHTTKYVAADGFRIFGGSGLIYRCEVNIGGVT